MKHFYIFTLVFALLLIAVIFRPELLINPGVLSESHKKLDGSCLGCHTPFFGTPSAKCIACHTVEEIGLKNVSGKDLAEADSVIALLHTELAASECIACHTEHALPGKGSLLANMDHGSLTAERQKNCTACHEPDMPDDFLHEKAGPGCGECHDTRRWEPAEFDHDRWLRADTSRSGNCTACHDPDRPDDLLHKEAGSGCGECHDTRRWEPAEFDHDRWLRADTERSGRCAACHKPDRPEDLLHREAKNACIDCHTTTAWKPANFDHEQWFRFDRSHPAECSTCHENPRDYRQYTCYGCHEHSRRGVAAEHREEGIREFSNCAGCHRSSDEDEAERLWREKRR